MLYYPASLSRQAERRPAVCLYMYVCLLWSLYQISSYHTKTILHYSSCLIFHSFKVPSERLKWLDEELHLCITRHKDTFLCAWHCKQDSFSLILRKYRFLHHTHLTLIIGFKGTRETWSISSPFLVWVGRGSPHAYPSLHSSLALLSFPHSLVFCCFLESRSHQFYCIMLITASKSLPLLRWLTRLIFPFCMTESNRYWNIQELTHRCPSTKIIVRLSTNTLRHN